MKLTSLLNPDLVVTNLAAADSQAAVAQLIAALGKGRSVDREQASRDVRAREQRAPTLIPLGSNGVAIPHAITGAGNQLMMALGTSLRGIPWTPANGKANVIFLLLGPPQTQPLYLRLLSRIAHLCEAPGLLDSLLKLNTPAQMLSALAEAEEPLGELVAGEGMPTFCIVGAGHGGMAMAGHLALTGCKVNLFNRGSERLQAVQARGGLDVCGEVEGFASLNVVTADPAEGLNNVDVVMVVVPATAHRDVAGIIAPHLADGQIVVLNPGRTGGALEVARIIRQTNPSARPYIAEAQTLLYASRVTNPGQVRIFGIKNSVPVATLPAYQIADVLPVIRKALPQFVPGDNVLKTSLDNIGAVFHPAITILNAGRIEDTHGDFEYYLEGVTPAVARVLEAIDRERVAVAAALGIRANTAREWLYLAYDAAGKTLLDAMRNNPGYRGINAPGTIEHRYISEDVPASLVPIASIGQMFNVPTPHIRAMIDLASAMHGTDYWAEGRSVERLGIKGMTLKDIRFLVVGAEPDAGKPPAAEPERIAAARV